jgi:hypothetical protein
MPVTGTTVNINGITITDGVLSATTYENIPTVVFTGGTVEGLTEFTTGLNAATISATTYENLPNFGFTGGTVDGFTDFTNGLNATTISATTYENLPNFGFTGGTVDGFTDFTNGLLTTTMSATTFYGDGSQLTGISGGTNGIITVNVSELNALISGDTLVAGATYEVTGVDVNLYSGTTIFLQALTSNELKSNGSGLFYNPKYTEDPIWTNLIGFNMESVVGEFGYDEMVVSDTNAFGFLKTYGMIEWMSGDWTSATTFTGISSSSVALISGVNFSKYILNDTVIWGGKKWVNVSGDTIAITDEVLGIGDGVSNNFNFVIENRPINVGSFTLTDGVEMFTGDTAGVMTGDLGGVGQIDYLNGEVSVIFTNVVVSGSPITASYNSTGIGYSINDYTLSNIWEEIPFNNTDYDIVLDEINYDIKHDMIISRKDKFNNFVDCTYQAILEMNQTNDLANPIKDFQWGSGIDNWGYGSGLYYFSDKLDSNNGINDGGDDMYDGANEIYTDLGNVPYTHTRLTIEPDGGTPANLFQKDGQVVSGDTYFNVGSEYFTNLYPGLFVLHANSVQITEFRIDGGIGADEDGQYEVDEYVLTGFSTNYKVFVKKVYDSGDPSINHIMIVDTDDVNIVHDYDTYNEDDYDKISNLSGATKIHYLLTALYPGIGYITKTKIDEIVTTYLTLVDGLPTTLDVLTTLNNNYETITNLLPEPQSTSYRGVMGNYVKDSYLGCLNFGGGYIWNNNLTQRSFIAFNYFTENAFGGSSNISDNDLTGNSYIANNYLSNSSNIMNNNLNHYSYITDNRMDSNSDIESNEFIFNSSMSNNKLSDNFDIRKNKFTSNAYFSNNTFDGGVVSFNSFNAESNVNSNHGLSFNFERNTISQGGGFYNNTVFDVYIRNNSLMSDSGFNNNGISGCTVANNFLSTSSIYNNTIDAIGFGSAQINDNILSSSSIYNNVFSGGSNSISSNNLSLDCRINNNQLGGSSAIYRNMLLTQSVIELNNLPTQAYIHSNSLDSDSLIRYCNFGLNGRINNCNLTNNSRFELNMTPSIDLSIIYINANHGFLAGDLTTATTVYSQASKSLVANSIGESALMFIDENFVQQIVQTNN